jgi:hypothetical protein
VDFWKVSFSTATGQGTHYARTQLIAGPTSELPTIRPDSLFAFVSPTAQGERIDGNARQDKA